MGLFDLFKRKQTEQIQPIAQLQKEEPVTKYSDYNDYLIEGLKDRLIEMGHEVERHPQHLTLILNSGLEISTSIIDVPDAHPFLIQLNILTRHPIYLEQGIYECLAGIGETMDKRITSALDNYVNFVFSAIIGGFTDTHEPETDMLVITNEREILWHPKIGDLMVQGQWGEMPDGIYLFEILRDKIKSVLIDNKFNSLKIYISKRADGTIIGECVFNNRQWNDGLDEVTKHAESWIVKGDFMALKQFIMFRRCDAYDK
ncbi:hypothetical protein SAMN05192574_111162 [Mucilaginibacter gossypiicola]|uniref:Uncharacterized protein n=1 Tax=Mucilaginibacter gossypiicola TaxID=551995 RepID=A0A1H8S3N0_9SPHI|nr:DUF6348 family protein [Mucilaginibacter gossypiicola]SEO73146.1 hypothetical protein SAMN05192574_111162 [Mucilaginibacter gossypiicola]